MTPGDGLDDFLVSLADGLADARDRLAEPTPEGASGALVTYQLPRLEFELKVNVSTVTTRSGRETMARPTKRRIHVAPPTSRTESASVSVIRGVFVAVPVDGGVPRPVLQIMVRSTDSGGRVCEVSVHAVDGAPVVGVEVALDVDRELSQQLNGRALATATGLAAGIVVADADGIGRTTLSVAGSEPAGTAIAVSAEAGGARDTLVYRTDT